MAARVDSLAGMDMVPEEGLVVEVRESFVAVRTHRGFASGHALAVVLGRGRWIRDTCPSLARYVAELGPSLVAEGRSCSNVAEHNS